VTELDGIASNTLISLVDSSEGGKVTRPAVVNRRLRDSKILCSNLHWEQCNCITTWPDAIPTASLAGLVFLHCYSEI